MEPSPHIDPIRLLRLSSQPKNPPSGDRVRTNARLRFALAQALARDQLLFCYQPVACASNPRFPAFHEMMSLLRMPNGQLVPTHLYTASIEENEIGRTIDRLTLKRALQKLEENQALRLSINISPQCMGDVQWHALLEEAFASKSGACGRLILEVSENAAVHDADMVDEFATHVRKFGPAFAFDRFGAGATGFSHFRRLKFDLVKIAPAFCHGVHANRDAQVLVECLQRISMQFDMFCVADGVENEADAIWLCDAGIDCIQGRFYGHPKVQPEAPSVAGPARDAC
ncbi:MAG: EAL domain-containing protein [Pseudomonadota bacterium]